MTCTTTCKVDELRMSVSRTEQQAAWREDHMRQELADMQQVMVAVHFCMAYNRAVIFDTILTVLFRDCKRLRHATKN